MTNQEKRKKEKFCPNCAFGYSVPLVMDVFKSKLVCPVCKYTRDLTPDETSIEKEKIKNAVKTFVDAAGRRTLEIMKENGSFMRPKEFIDFHADGIVGITDQKYGEEQKRKEIRRHLNAINSYLESLVIEAYKAGYDEAKCLMGGTGEGLKPSKELAYLLKKWKESDKDE